MSMISATATTLLRVLTDAAEAGAPCPSNFALMDALDLVSPDGISKALAQLRRAGLIDLDREGQRRRVTILATGARTEWSGGAGRAKRGGWDAATDATLVRMANEGLDLDDMAARLQKTSSAVRHRLRRLRGTSGGHHRPASASDDVRPCPGRPVQDRPEAAYREVIHHAPPAGPAVLSPRPPHEAEQIARFLAERGVTRVRVLEASP